jgi:exodeoxyribonuclease-3
MLRLMKVATWNVNSIRTRLERVLNWLRDARPDVLCLQELKAAEEQFPFEPFEHAGYFAAVAGQKTYNGVAILSRRPPEDVRVGLGGPDEDPQARLISAAFGEVRIFSVYVPNGRAVGSDKFAYKLAWLDALGDLLRRDHAPSQPLLLCGDFNVAPADLDVHDPEAWADTVLCTPAAREAFDDLLDWGLVDLYRRLKPDAREYTWWDYRRLAFPRNEGLRIDHVLATAPLAERCRAVEIVREQRKGEKPSDHAPMLAELDLPV